MNFYLIIIIILTMFSLFCYMQKRISYAAGSRKIRRNLSDHSNRPLFLMLSAAALVIITGFRNNMGTDYVTYEFEYKYQIKNYGLLEIIAHREPLFALIEKMIGEVSDYNIVALMTVLAVITVAAIFHFFKEESESVWLCILLLLTVGSYYTSFNTTRIYLAAALYLLLFKYIYRHKPGAYTAGVILISFIHVSAIVLIPMYWMLKINWSGYKKKIFMVWLGIGYLAVFFFLRQILDAVSYSKIYLLDYEWTGVSPVSLARPLMIVLAVLLNAGHFDKNNVKHRILLNAPVYFFLLQLLALKYYMVYRFTYYFSLISIVSLVHAVVFIKYSEIRRLWASLILLFALLWSFLGGQFSAGYSFCWQENVMFY